MKFKVVLLGLVIMVTTSCAGLKSRTDIGLTPEQHSLEGVNVRKFTKAPLGAEVKVYLPISREKAMEIVADFDNYPKWVSPAPEKVSVDNTKTKSGKFGVGSRVSYKKAETDVIEYFSKTNGMIARPLWGQDSFKGHRGVVLVTKYKQGSLIHMRRYFKTSGIKGWFMSKMMPMFMKSSAENLAEQYGGEVL